MEDATKLRAKEAQAGGLQFCLPREGGKAELQDLPSHPRQDLSTDIAQVPWLGLTSSKQL